MNTFEDNPWFLSNEEIADLAKVVEIDSSIDVMPRPAEPTFIVGG